MKRSLFIPFLVILGSVFLFSASLSQTFLPDTARIAFVTSERTAILAKKIGGKLDTLFTSYKTIKPRNLSVLASTADGKSLLIAGYFIYLNTSGQPDSVAAFAKINAPFKNTGIYRYPSGSITPDTLGGAIILKVIPTPEANFTKTLPLGVLTSDGNEWYGTWSKAQAGNGQEWFYHGNFSGLGGTDSIQIGGSYAAGDGYHMTNLIMSEDNLTMLTVIMDQIQSDQPRAQLISWQPSLGGGNQTLIAVPFSGLIKGQSPAANIDTSFGFYFHILPVVQTGITSAELALEPKDPSVLHLYKIRIINSAVNDFADQSRQIYRGNIPLLDGTDTVHLFTGFTGDPASDWDDREVITPLQGFPCGNGGDMMASFGGDSVVFVTCNKTNNATAKESGIYIYDLLTNKAYLVENDETKMERQPIFMGSIPVLAPPPPYIVGTATLDKTSMDFGTHIDDGTDKTTLIATLTASNASEVIVTQAIIGGPDAANFSVTLTPSLPATIKGYKTYLFPVTFAPTAVQSYSATLTIHYIDSLRKGEKDSILTVQLTGVGEKPTGGVNIKTPAAFDLSVIPNPFSSVTQITVTAQQTGSTSLEIRDLLGREIYSSKSFTLGAGEKFSYTLDANALHLAPGEYFVLVRSGGEEVTRKVIYVK